MQSPWGKGMVGMVPEHQGGSKAGADGKGVVEKMVSDVS